MMLRPTLIPSVRFNSHCYEERLRLDALKEASRGVWRVEPNRSRRRPVVASGQGWRLGDVVISRLTLGGFAQIGQKGSASEGMIQVRLYRSGRSLGFFDSETRILRPGSVHIFDSRFQIHTLESCNLVSLSLPSDLIGFDRSRHGAHLVFPTDRPTGRVLESAITALVDALPTATLDQSAALSTMLTGLFRGVLAGSNCDPEAKASASAMRAQAMKVFVKQHLEASDIDIDGVRRAFRTSRATVCRAFAEDGGIDHFIANERLDRALADLADEPQTLGRVARVAHRWQYFDASHFNRAFHRRHGFSPSETPMRLHPLDTEGSGRTTKLRSLSPRLLTTLYAKE